MIWYCTFLHLFAHLIIVNYKFPLINLKSTCLSALLNNTALLKTNNHSFYKGEVKNEQAPSDSVKAETGS